MARRFPGPLRVRIVEGEPSCPVKFVTTGPRVPCVIVNEEPALHGRIVGPTDPAMRLEGNYGYFNKVLGYGPLVYFPQWEAEGAASEELVNGWDGAYVGVTLGQPGIGDGNTAPFFDGANDYNDIWTAALAAAFNGGEGTAAIWARVGNAGTWTDGTDRHAITLRVDANNRIQIKKDAVNNRLEWLYRAGGVSLQAQRNAEATLNWMHLALTWSATANQVIAYFNGAQEGAILAGLGVWAGALAANVTVIGAGSTVPGNVWHGWLAHGAVWTRALAPAEIADLATV